MRVRAARWVLTVLELGDDRHQNPRLHRLRWRMLHLPQERFSEQAHAGDLLGLTCFNRAFAIWRFSDGV